MTRILFCLIALLVACAAPAAQDEARPVNRFGLSKPLPRPEGSIRIATYNVLNLFDPFDDPALEGQWDDDENVTELPRAAKIAEAIRTVDADIIALQEVESLDALKWLRDTYLPDAGYKYLASIDVGYFRGVECSVMSRFPITDARVWAGMSLDDVRRTGPGWSDPADGDPARGLSFRRSPLMVQVEVNRRYELTIFSLHHKAGSNQRYQREAEALKIVELTRQIEQDDPDRNIIVMGDFNAAPWDKSVRVYREAGFVDTHSHRVIPRWRDADQTEARLFKTHESDRVLDYILMNAAAYREFIVGTAHVYGTLTPPESYDWRTDPKPDGYASDHYPVIVDLVPRDR